MRLFTILFLGIMGTAFSCTSFTADPYGPTKNNEIKLPVLYIDNYQILEEQLERTVYTARVQVFANTGDYHWDSGTPGFLAETPVISPTLGSIKIRGQSSAGIDKHSFALEFLDPKNPQKDKKISLLNFPPESDFVLHSPWYSVTVFPNYLAYSLSNKLRIWAPKVKFVELYSAQLNDDLETVYQGIYLLTEKIKLSKNRIALEKITDQDPSGGYLLKVDKISPQDKKFTTNLGVQVIIESPKAPSEVQLSYLQKFFQGWESSLDSQGSDWENWIDSDSFADQFLLNESLGNVDGLKYSSFFTKDKGGKLRCGPLWDVDLAMGQTWWGNDEETWEMYPGPRWEITHSWNIIKSASHPPWWKKLLSKAEFFETLRKRWKYFRENAMNLQTLEQLMDQGFQNLGVKGQGASKTWGHYADEVKLWPWENRMTKRGQFPETLYFTLEGQNPLELNHQYLKAWLVSRFEWLDKDETWEKLRKWARSGA